MKIYKIMEYTGGNRYKLKYKTKNERVAKNQLARFRKVYPEKQFELFSFVKNLRF